MPAAESHVDRRYIAILCLASLLILVVGVWLRPPRTPPPVPSELETLNMQLARQRLDFDRRSLFFARKAEELAKSAAEVRSRPESAPFRTMVPGDMVLLVATGSQGELVWAPAQATGPAETPCGEMIAQEITTTIAIPVTLSSAVAFDLDNNPAGLALTCGDRQILTTPATFRQWTAERTHEANLDSCCGLRVTSTLEVVSVGTDSVVAKTGLRVGDTILNVDAAAVASRSELHGALTSSPPPTVLTIRRGERTRKLTIRRAVAP